MDINMIGREACAINLRNGWGMLAPEMFPREVEKLCANMALVHTEVSEATEAIRKLDLVNFREELADIVIRVASIASGLGIDLGAEISDKLDHNRTRGYRHGGKAI